MRRLLAISATLCLASPALAGKLVVKEMVAKKYGGDGPVDRQVRADVDRAYSDQAGATNVVQKEGIHVGRQLGDTRVPIAHVETVSSTLDPVRGEIFTIDVGHTTLGMKTRHILVPVGEQGGSRFLEGDDGVGGPKAQAVLIKGRGLFLKRVGASGELFDDDPEVGLSAEWKPAR
jgi:hypothetical protein